VDDIRIGLALRSVRRRLGIRQADVAGRAQVSQQLVSLVERGQLDRVSMHSLRRMAAAVEVRIVLEARWRGSSLPRLLDMTHAQLVERVASTFRRHGWDLLVEYSFSHYGERGAVDLVAWHPVRRVLALIEVKTAIVDLQDLHATMDRKRRVVPALLARERGWRPTAIGEILVVSDTRAHRTLVRTHATTFGVRLPERGAAARAWVRDPAGPIRACWFLALTTPVGGNRGSPVPQRVRVRSPRSDPG
jgi:transcriptional regulator with XRE-family HTH domain